MLPDILTGQREEGSRGEGVRAGGRVTAGPAPTARRGARGGRRVTYLSDENRHPGGMRATRVTHVVPTFRASLLLEDRVLQVGVTDKK